MLRSGQTPCPQAGAFDEGLRKRFEAKKLLASLDAGRIAAARLWS